MAEVRGRCLSTDLPMAAAKEFTELSGYQTRKCYLFNPLHLISGSGQRTRTRCCWVGQQNSSCKHMGSWIHPLLSVRAHCVTARWEVCRCPRARQLRADPQGCLGSCVTLQPWSTMIAGISHFYDIHMQMLFMLVCCNWKEFGKPLLWATLFEFWDGKIDGLTRSLHSRKSLWKGRPL